MLLNDKHKAMLITFLISGIVMLAMFSIHIKKKNPLIAESYFVIEPEEMLDEEILKILENDLGNNSPETNQAFNETKQYAHFDKAYKLIEPPKDYENPLLDKIQNPSEAKEKESIDEIDEITEAESQNFSKVNSILEKQTQSEEGANKNSSISYSLKDRTDVFLPPPIYLCEQSGKIVINITVNSDGKVIDTYVNTSSNSSNECLIDHAIEYAMQAHFSSDTSKKTQLGSITFHFIGKH